jgi:hypothetical protein
MSVSLDRERFERLMTAALDGELSAGEQRELDDMLAGDESLQKEFLSYKQIKEVTSVMKFKAPLNEVWDHYWLDVYNRIERGLGWLLFTIGAVILLTYSGFKLIENIIHDSGLALFARIGLLALIAGLAVLLVSVVREKWFAWKNDPYKEILR